MYISKLSLVNYRNFSNAKFLFKKGLNTVIGENGSGKSNLFRAIRLMLDDSLLRYAYKLNEKDFSRSIGSWKGHWIIISIEFDDIDDDESIQSLFIHGIGKMEENKVKQASYNLIFRPKSDLRIALSKIPKGDSEKLTELLESISIDDYEVIFTGKSTSDFNDPEVYKKVVGDFKNVDFPEDLDPMEIGLKVPHQLSVKKEVSFSFVKALRDVVADFQNNRTNPLFSLLKIKSEEMSKEKFSGITEQVQDLNSSIESLKDIETLRADVLTTIKETVGETYSPSSLSIKSSLSEEAELLLQSLKLFIGENGDEYEGGVHELSLGGANLVYLTLKLLEFKYGKARDTFANFLLIEEPEAHIHTHIQKTLFDKVDYSETQVIFSTHSTHISEVSNLRNMNILTKNGVRCNSFQPSNGLDDTKVVHIERYLDAVRSNLLFAKSVILVEGDAEEILIPIMLKKMLGVTLDELGISIVNIRSTGFENIACLFEESRIRRKCAIITDLDKSIMDGVNPGENEKIGKYIKKCKNSEKKGKERQERLDKEYKKNHWVKAFYATNTFEVNFFSEGNSCYIDKIANEVYTDPKTISKAIEELKSNDISVYGKRALTMANFAGKGWYAILVGGIIDGNCRLPNYIVDSILFSCSKIQPKTIIDIISYRISIEEKSCDLSKIKNAIKSFNLETDNIKHILELAKEEFKNSSASYFLERL